MKTKIEKLIFGGFGFGRLKNGKPVFVKKTVPGDEIEIEIIKDKKSYAEAVIKKITKPSPNRIDSCCKYFSICGGCDYQNISYSNQLKYKQEIFEEILFRAGIKTKPENIMAGSKDQFYYRNSIRFFFLDKEDGSISFARNNYLFSNKLTEITACLLQSKTTNLILSSIKKIINQNIKDKKALWQIKFRQGKFTNEIMVEIITCFEELPKKSEIVDAIKNIDGVKSIYHTIAPGKSLKKPHRHLLFGSPIIFEKIGPYKFQISPESFFQTNSLGIKTLYDQIKKVADIKMGDNVLDLYSGTGSIGIYLSTLAKKVIGVETESAAVRDANDNAILNNIKNTEFVCSDAFKFLRSHRPKSSFDIIITDPPRAGLNKKIIKQLSKYNFRALIYVSCNPATFARDIRLFENYDLNLIKTLPIDMFPQTHHLECIGLIQKTINKQQTDLSLTPA